MNSTKTARLTPANGNPRKDSRATKSCNGIKPPTRNAKMACWSSRPVKTACVTRDLKKIPPTGKRTAAPPSTAPDRWSLRAAKTNGSSAAPKSAPASKRCPDYGPPSGRPVAAAGPTAAKSTSWNFTKARSSPTGSGPAKAAKITGIAPPARSKNSAKTRGTINSTSGSASGIRKR